MKRKAEGSALWELFCVLLGLLAIGSSCILLHPALSAALCLLFLLLFLLLWQRGASGEQDPGPGAVGEALRGLRHDYKNHLRVLASLAEQGQDQAILAYLAALQRPLYRAGINSGHPALDALLQEKLGEAEARGVAFDLELYLPERLGLGSTELCSLLFNLVDNALEACAENLEAANRRLSLRIQQRGDFLRIHCENPSERAPRFIKGRPLSQKGPGHGQGLRQIARTAKKYGGALKTDYREGVFTAQVLLNNPACGERRYAAHVRLE